MDTGETGAAMSRSSRVIPAKRERLYQALVKPAALEQWLVPEGMTGKVHHFEARVGGGYSMSLYYPESAGPEAGKSGPGEDRYSARFVELVPPERIVLAVKFDNDDPAFAGEFTLSVTYEPRDGGTEVTLEFEDLPPGIDPQQNDELARQALEKLERYVASTCKPAKA